MRSKRSERIRKLWIQIFLVCAVGLLFMGFHIWMALHGTLPKLDFYMFFLVIMAMSWGIPMGLLSAVWAFMLRNYGIESFLWGQVETWVPLIYYVLLVILVGGQLSLLRGRIDGYKQAMKEAEAERTYYQDRLQGFEEQEKVLTDQLRSYRGGAALWLERMALWMPLSQEELLEKVTSFIEREFEFYHPQIRLFDGSEEADRIFYLEGREWLILDGDFNDLPLYERHQFDLLQMALNQWRGNRDVK